MNSHILASILVSFIMTSTTVANDIQTPPSGFLEVSSTLLNQDTDTSAPGVSHALVPFHSPAPQFSQQSQQNATLTKVNLAPQQNLSNAAPNGQKAAPQSNLSNPYHPEAARLVQSSSPDTVSLKQSQENKPEAAFLLKENQGAPNPDAALLKKDQKLRPDTAHL